MEEAAGKLCNLFFTTLTGPAGEPGCALVRCYKTHRYADLPEDLQQFAAAALAPLVPNAETSCLILLATAGEQPAWNSRHESHGHKAIPLASPEVIERAPMISQMLKELGVDVRSVVGRAPDMFAGSSQNQYGVFFVANAVGSPHIPDQEGFVVPFGIRSVIGFGGALSSGELFTVILFSKVAIGDDVAARFRALGADVRFILGGYRENFIFALGGTSGTSLPAGSAAPLS